MRSRLLPTLAASSVVVLALAGPPPALSATAERTVHLTFGLGATAEERWDGWLEVRGGALERLDTWHFLDREPLSREPRVAELTGPSSWRVSTRRDAVDGFHRINYLEMAPSQPLETFHLPVGIWATVRDQGAAAVEVRTAQGDFAFRLADLEAGRRLFLDGRAAAVLVPTPELLTGAGYEDDDPAITALPGGGLAVAWVAYAGEADRVLMRVRSGGAFAPAEEVTPAPGDLFRVSLAVDGEGGLWAFWSARDGATWHLWGRRRDPGGRWREPVQVSGDGSNVFHRAAARDGDLFVAWQSLAPNAAGEPSSDIWLRRLHGGRWGPPVRVSESPRSDWEPALAVGPGGRAWVAWDSYDRGSYDVLLRSWDGSALGPLLHVTTSPRFEAQADVAIDSRGVPWIAWNESGVNWGKDQGFLINPPLSTPIHQERSVRVARWDGARFQLLTPEIPPFYRYRVFSNVEKPRLAFDGGGGLTLVFRHWTRQMARAIGAPQLWESYVTRFTGSEWTWPAPLPHTGGSIEKLAALAVDGAGEPWAAWMTDGRTLSETKPANAEVWVAQLGRAPALPADPVASLAPWVEPPAEAVPIHLREAEDVRRVRDYVVESGGRRYRIYRGDLHRHSDVSQDFKYDGSLIELYRYALDAAALDFLAPADHQAGWDQEFTWWQGQKLADLFHLPGVFTPIFAYERSLPYPNGHRNVFFEERGVRTLPIRREEQDGREGAAELYRYLRLNDGISMPHSSGTDQGTDWRDNDPELEPLIEIFQGYRASYEYPGAPRAASDQKLLAQRSGYQPLGYWWKALERGYKLGVQASSDHWSTHISYACILAESGSRADLFDAIRKRHAYGATDNIVLDVRGQVGGVSYLMGDIVEASEPPRISVRVLGTGEVSQVVVVKNQEIVYTAHPGAREVALEFLDARFEPGTPAYYYVRVLQSDGQMAWSSPIWVEPPGGGG